MNIAGSNRRISVDSGDVYGNWTVVSEADTKRRPYRGKAMCVRMVEVVCSCGNLATVELASLRSGKSAGCHNCAGRIPEADKVKPKKPSHEKYILRSAKFRAKKKGLPFNITIDDIHIPETCPVLGIPMFHAVGKGRMTDNSPSLDRHIPELGYVKGNVAVISMRANRIKDNGSPEEHEMIAKWMRSVL